MAISAGTVGEVRPLGSDANGGLYYSSQPGADTDYSQQDAAQLSVSDGVTNGTSTVTSVTGGFTAHMIGNGINIAGTCYMIATFSTTNSITVDRNIGANTGLAMNVGGGWATPAYGAGQLTTSCQMWVKSGTTYTLSSTASNVSGGRITSSGGSAQFPFVWEGYQTTRGDKGTKPVIDDGGLGGGGGMNMFTCSGTDTVIDNIELSGSNSNNVLLNLSASFCLVIRCKVSGAATGFYQTGNYNSISSCEGACTTNTSFDLRAICWVMGCTAHGGSVAGFTVTGSNGASFSNCIAYSNGGAGFTSGSTNLCSYINCTAYNNTGDGFVTTSSGDIDWSAINCIAVSNGGYGFNSSSVRDTTPVSHGATYSNTSGATHNLTRTEGMVTLSGDPFVAAGTNFGLNNTAGAGAACRAAGTPAAFPGLSSTIAYLDIGAVQHQDSGTGTVISITTSSPMIWDAFTPTPYR